MIDEIIVSLITSVITWTVLTVGKTTLIPYYESLVYKGVFVKGTWTQTTRYNENTEDEVSYNETFVIHQKANKLTGIYTVTNMFKNESSLTSIYHFQGTLENNFLTLMGRIDDKKQIGHNCFLLKVVAGGQQLIGSTIFLDRRGDEPISYPEMVYSRQL